MQHDTTPTIEERLIALEHLAPAIRGFAAIIEAVKLYAVADAAVAAERERIKAALLAEIAEQGRIATAERVADDGSPSSTGLRGQAAGREQACAALRAFAARLGGAP